MKNMKSILVIKNKKILKIKHNYQNWVKKIIQIPIDQVA